MVAGPQAGRRVVLRRWTKNDLDAFADLNGDPQVMATIGPMMDRDASAHFLQRIDRHFDDHGFGLWCVDVEGEAVGFCGLMVPWFRDGVEIGWRLRSQWWGNGFASEAARCVLAYAFAEKPDGLGFDEVISFTAVTNTRSQRVMEAIGMSRVGDGDFDHPGVPESSPLRPHVLYQLPVGRYGSMS